MKTAISVFLFSIISIGGEMPSTSGRLMPEAISSAPAITTTSSSKYLLDNENGSELGPTSLGSSNPIESSNTFEEGNENGIELGPSCQGTPKSPNPIESNTFEEGHVMVMHFVAVPKPAVQTVVIDIGSIHMIRAVSPGAIGVLYDDKNDTTKISGVEWALNTWGKWVLLVLVLLSLGLTIHCTFNYLVSQPEPTPPSACTTGDTSSGLHRAQLTT